MLLFQRGARDLSTPQNIQTDRKVKLTSSLQKGTGCSFGVSYRGVYFATYLYLVSISRMHRSTGLSEKMDGIWNRYNLKSTGRIYTFGVLKCSEEFKVLDLP